LTWIAECEYKHLKQKEEKQKAKLDDLLHSFSQTDGLILLLQNHTNVGMEHDSYLTVF
jgi:hypothetical protein